MDRKELFKTIPWYVQFQWWTLTLLAAIYIVPVMLIVILNPLWFRQAGLTWIVIHTENLSRFRDKLLRPQIQKYKIFDILKDID
jgi:hypothetical protein